MTKKKEGIIKKYLKNYDLYNYTDCEDLEELDFMPEYYRDFEMEERNRLEEVAFQILNNLEYLIELGDDEEEILSLIRDYIFKGKY